MKRADIHALASLIVFGDRCLQLGDLANAVDAGLRRADPFELRNWEEIAGLLEDTEWLVPFLGCWMRPESLCRIRGAFMEQIAYLEAQGRVRIDQ